MVCIPLRWFILCVVLISLGLWNSKFSILQAQKDRVLDDMKATMATALKESCNRVLGDYQVWSCPNHKRFMCETLEISSANLFKATIFFDKVYLAVENQNIGKEANLAQGVCGICWKQKCHIWRCSGAKGFIICTKRAEFWYFHTLQKLAAASYTVDEIYKLLVQVVIFGNFCISWEV